MNLPPQPAQGPGTEYRECSAKGCREPAVWRLVWNNPRVHSPERRKTWLACEGHRSYLGSFLDRRNFLREVVELDSG